MEKVFDLTALSFDLYFKNAYFRQIAKEGKNNLFASRVEIRNYTISTGVLEVQLYILLMNNIIQIQFWLMTDISTEWSFQNENINKKQ